ncbi:MAG: DUF6702 family protein [Planctomycetota bacterium]
MIWLLCLPWLLMHPAHTSMAELRWNEERRCVEVSLRLSRNDAEALRQSQQRPRSESDATKTEVSADELATAALRQHLQFGIAQSGDRYRWIGEEPDGFHVWWHFEFQSHDLARPTKLRSSLLQRHAIRDAARGNHAAHSMVQMAFVVLPGPGESKAKGTGDRSIVIDENGATASIPWFK